MTKKKDKPLTLTEKYDIVMEYIHSIDDAKYDEDFINWCVEIRGLTDDQIKQFERVPF